MKTAKKNSLRPIFINNMVIKPTKVLRTNSIRPARSLRKSKIQIQTPVQALFNRKFSPNNNSQE